MKRMTKLLSLVLAALMLVGMLPLGVWAAGETHTVRFNLNYNGAPKLSDQKVADGEYATQPEGVIREGWHFAYWYVKLGDNKVETFDLAATPITKDVTLYARWTEDTLARAKKMAQGLELAKRMEEKEEPEEPEKPKEGFILYVDQSLLTIEQTPKIYFYAETEDAVDSITLLHGTEPVATLYDDGQFNAHGDDIAGDGIYSAYIETAAYDAGTEKFTATYDGNVSNAVEVTFYHMISDEVLEILDTANTYIRNLVDSDNFKKMSIADRKIAADKLVDTLIDKNLIVEESLYYDEIQYLYCFVFTGDILGGIELDIDSIETNGGGIDNNLFPPESISTTNAIDTEAETNLGSALILYTFNEKDRGPYLSMIKKWEKKGLTTTFNTSPTVPDYKEIYKYNVVTFSSHGNYLQYDGMNKPYPIICLTEESTTAKNSEYSLELSSQQIGVSNGQYRILPSFFEYWIPDDSLNRTFIFCETCRALGMNMEYDYILEEVMVKKGAASFVGFHNSVDSKYSRELMKKYFDELLMGNTSKQAFDTVTSKLGASDAEYLQARIGSLWKLFKANGDKFNPSLHIAYPHLFGDNSAVLINTGIKNGDFELSLQPNITKAPPYWTCVGDARIMKQLGEILPYSSASSAFGNKQMGMITTGVGSKSTSDIGAGTEGSYIAQHLLVPKGAKTLTFNYNFVSEEPLEYVGSQFDDAFGIQIVEGNKTVVNQIFESINTSTWYPVSGINFDGGDDTVFHTKWKEATVDISKYAGKVIKLYFVIYDVGDSIYDSACLLDNITIN